MCANWSPSHWEHADMYAHTHKSAHWQRRILQIERRPHCTHTQHHHKTVRVPSDGILEIISDADWSFDFVMASSCCSLFTSDTSCSARAENKSMMLKRLAVYIVIIITHNHPFVSTGKGSMKWNKAQGLLMTAKWVSNTSIEQMSIFFGKCVVCVCELCECVMHVFVCIVSMFHFHTYIVERSVEWTGGQWSLWVSLSH